MEGKHGVKSEEERIAEILSNCTEEKDDICFRKPTNTVPTAEIYWEVVEAAAQFFLLSYRGLSMEYSQGLAVMVAAKFVGDSPLPPQGMKQAFILDRAIEIARQLAKSLASQPERLKEYSWFNGGKEWSVFALKNQRRKMEDRHVLVPKLGILFPHVLRKEDTFCAVFDGHMGSECADYAGVHFLSHFVKAPSFEADPAAAFVEAFASFDETLVQKCQKENIRSGCTAVCALIREEKITVAWAGDSQAALLSAYGTSSMLTVETHNPDKETEYHRIEAAGGAVLSIQGELRVNGVLNLSRSFGDAVLKPNILISKPDTNEADFSALGDILVLGCDGIWDHIEADEATSVVRDFIASNPPTEHKELGRAIGNRARTNGSADNLSVVVVFLRPVNTVWSRFKGL